ncbi:aldose 1-epimerase [Paraburkholderia fungorum]|uniref:aldose 1-epimerase n=1 Tax=Paraburkholderia fungorum TaxID=134537 RepID=UPI0038B6FAF3
MTLANAYLKLDVVSGVLGGVTRFDWNDRGMWAPVFLAPSAVTSGVDTRQLACHPVFSTPFCLGRGQSCLTGCPSGPLCDCAEDRVPVGDGRVPQDWEIESADARCVRLRTVGTLRKPYHAIQTYQIDGPTLTVTIEIENRGRRTSPFGIGIRPFLVRDADTGLCAPASGLWLTKDDWDAPRHVPTPPAWQFGVTYPLPRSLVDHVFTGWGGRAFVEWPTRQFALTISANAANYALHIPRQGRFFCFQPGDGRPGAVSLSGRREANGLTMLAAGERLSRRFSFTAERLGSLTKTVGQ